MLPVLPGSVCLLCGRFLTPQHTGGADQQCRTPGAGPPACSQMLGQPSLDPLPGAQEPSKALETPSLSTSPSFCHPPPPPAAGPAPSWGRSQKSQQVAVQHKALVGLGLKRTKSPILLSPSTYQVGPRQSVQMTPPHI